MAAKLAIHKKIPREDRTITFKGTFHMKNFYQWLHDWIKEEGFSADNGGGGDQWETFYWERRSQAGFTDYNIWWRMTMGASSWWQYKLSINFIGLAIAKTDVMHEGKKFGAYKGELTMMLKGTVILDPSGKWKTGDVPLAEIGDEESVNKLHTRFVNRLYKKDVKHHKDMMDNVLDRLQENIKDFLGLVTFNDFGEDFHPRKGMGWE